MKKLMTALSIAAAGIVGVYAQGIVATMEMKDLESKEPPSIQKLYITGNKVNMRLNAGGRSTAVIFRGDKQLMWTVNDENKEYFEMTKASMEQMGQSLNSAMAQLKAQMANMPPEQRAMMEQMLKGQMGQAAGSAEPVPPLTYKKTGTKKNISGYACELYDVFRGQEKLRQLWVTNWKNMKDFSEASKAFEAMGEFFKSMLEAFKDNPLIKSFDTPYSQTAELNGFPVLSVELKNGVPVMEVLLKSVEKKALGEDMFNPPKGYKANTSMFKPPRQR